MRQVWDLIELNIFSSKMWLKEYNICFQFSISDDKNNDIIYKVCKETLEEKYNEMNGELSETNGELNETNANKLSYLDCAQKFIRIFAYINRFYIPNRALTPLSKLIMHKEKEQPSNNNYSKVYL